MAGIGAGEGTTGADTERGAGAGTGAGTFTFGATGAVTAGGGREVLVVDETATRLDIPEEPCLDAVLPLPHASRRLLRGQLGNNRGWGLASGSLFISTAVLVGGPVLLPSGCRDLSLHPPNAVPNLRRLLHLEDVLVTAEEDAGFAVGRQPLRPDVVGQPRRLRLLRRLLAPAAQVLALHHHLDPAATAARLALARVVPALPVELAPSEERVVLVG